jgi:hypothetical protein
MKQLGRLGCVAVATTALIAFIGAASASAAFHSAEAGMSLNGTPTTTSVLSIQGNELVCKTGLLGGTSSGAPNTQVLAFSLSCFSSGYGWSSGNIEGCKFRFDQFQDATLHSCKKGGIELTWDSANYHCAVLIPNQTVPVTYKNGSEDAFLNVAFSSAFTANVTKAQQLCFLKVAEGVPVSLTTNYKVAAAGGNFWFDPAESEPSKFHTAASAAIEGTAMDGATTFKIDSGETLECQVGGLSGSFPGSASSETLGELAASPATGSCESSWWINAVSIDETGCKYVFHADGTADLEACSKGGIVVTWKIPYVVKCKVFIPNQSGASTVTYRNHGVNGDIGVRATLDLGLSGEVTEAGGFCLYGLSEEVSVSQESVTDFLSDEGATELWFG